MRPVIDMEKGIQSDDSYNAEWALSFCDEVEKGLGKRPIIYTARWYTQGWFNNASKDLLQRLSKETLWWAEYSDQQTKELTPWDEWLVWQFSGSGSISGVQVTVMSIGVPEESLETCFRLQQRKAQGPRRLS